MSALSLDIVVKSKRWKGNFSRSQAEKTVAQVLKKANYRHQKAQITVLLTFDRDISKINAAWRQKDKPTNVLSFPAPALFQKQGELGDILLSFETIKREARAEKKTFKAHLNHLLVHGTLHLLGFDHQNNADAQKMERLERKILLELGFNDPYVE